MLYIRLFSALSLFCYVFLSHIKAELNEIGCFKGLDITYVLDTSQSMTSTFNILASAIQNVQDDLLIKDAKNTISLGLVTFTDKILFNQEEIMSEDSYCAKVEVPLNGVQNNAIKKSLFNQIYKRQGSGGGDLPDNAFGAIYRALMSKQLRWTSVNGKKKKMLIVITDTVSHLPPDYSMQKLEQLRQFGFESELLDDINDDCNEMEYPSADQIENAIQENDASVLIMVANDPTLKIRNFYASQTMEPFKFYNQHLAHTIEEGKVTVARLGDTIKKIQAMIHDFVTKNQQMMCDDSMESVTKHVETTASTSSRNSGHVITIDWTDDQPGILLNDDSKKNGLDKTQFESEKVTAQQITQKNVNTNIKDELAAESTVTSDESICHECSTEGESQSSTAKKCDCNSRFIVEVFLKD